MSYAANPIREETFTIDNGETISSSIEIVMGGGQATAVRSTIVGLIIPDEFTTADLVLEGSIDVATWHPLRAVDGTAFTISSAVAEDWIVFEPWDMAGVQFIRFVSGSAQGADRLLVALMRWMS